MTLAVARTRALALLVVATFGLGAAATACGSDSVASTGPVSVSLVEHKIDPSNTKAKAGTVTFDIRNDGTETHEFLVVKSDLDPKALPLDEEGAVDEKGEGLEFIDEREDIEPGGTAKLTVDLQPGKYVLLCNLEDHYSMGMATAFTVTS
ncbi:MAG: cupredoxin domain-containing protein [Acidimicrobiales bacterium]